MELEEIEACICRHEQVVDAVVLAKDVGGGSLELVAFVAGKNELEMNALRGYLLATIPGYMVPGHLVKLDKLPLSANGKIDRKALQHTSMQADHAPQREAPATQPSVNSPQFGEKCWVTIGLASRTTSSPPGVTV